MHPAATRITTRRSQKRADTNTTTTYRTASAISKPVVTSATKTAAASATVKINPIALLCEGRRGFAEKRDFEVIDVIDGWSKSERGSRGNSIKCRAHSPN